MSKWVVRRGLVQGEGDYYHFDDADDGEDVVKNGWDPDPKTAQVFDTWAEAQQQVCASGTSCYATNESFSFTVQRALDEGLEVQALASEFECAVSTVRRWGAGTARPHPKLQEMILASLIKRGFGSCSSTRRLAIEECIRVCQDATDAASGSSYHPERKLGSLACEGRLRDLLGDENEDPGTQAVEELLNILYLYSGHSVNSRGPSGCIHRAIKVLKPEIASKLEAGVEPQDLIMNEDV